MLWLGRIVFGLGLRLVPQQAPIYLAIDETLVRRWGPHVPAVGMHRDAVQSSHGRDALNPGHKWVVVSLVVRRPYMNRPVALPILSALYTPPQQPKRNRTEPLYRRHRTVAELALVLVRLAVRWAPERRFIVAGDGAYATRTGWPGRCALSRLTGRCGASGPTSGNARWSSGTAGTGR